MARKLLRKDKYDLLTQLSL